MLSRSQRIPRSLFPTLLAEKRFANSAHFSLRFSFAAGQAPRAAVSVSKKVSKSAAARNRTRRRAYSALSPLFSSLPAGLYFFMAKAGAEKLKGDVLRAEISSLLKAAEKSYNAR